MKIPIILSVLLLSSPLARAENIADEKTPELIEWIVGKYYDDHLLQPDKIGEYQIGSAITDRFHKEGVVRLLISLPDGTRKTFDFDGRFSTTKPAKVEPTANATSRLSFVLNQSPVSVTSTTYQAKYSRATYQVWTIDKP